MAIYIRAKTHTNADKPSCRAAISELRSIFSCCRKNSYASIFLVSSALSCDHQPDSAIARTHTCVSFFTCSGSVSSLSSSFYERQSTHPRVCGADTEWYAVRTIVPLRRAASRSCPSISDCGCQSSSDDAVHIRTFAACMFSISLRSALMAVMPFSFS